MFGALCLFLSTSSFVFSQTPAQHVPVGQPVPAGQPVVQQQQMHQPAGQPVPVQINQPAYQQHTGQPGQPAVGGQPADAQTIPQPPGHNFGNQEELKDQQHIKTHLEGQVDTNQQMSQEQMRYHYFKMHDLNNDNMLDGIELIKAITHYHGDPNTPNAPPKLPDTDLENIIDNILRDDDFNRDGFIDYTEFIKSQAGRG